MRRRTFLKAAAGSVLWPVCSWAELVPEDLKVTRIVGFDLESERSKFVGRNSRLGEHGDKATDRMVRLYTNQGIEGLGNCRAGKEKLATLLGRNPFGFYRPVGRKMVGPLGAGTMPLWDLAGKVLGKPVYEMLGGAGRRMVGVYDGSIYFSDLLDDYKGAYLDRFREEIDMARAIGHRAFKIKIGRGAKWMDWDEGFARDKEVVAAIAEHAGDDAIIGVDANDGYELQTSKQFLGDLADVEPAFMEEMFPEDVDKCLEFKAFIRENRRRAKIADGETRAELEDYKPFIEARAVDIFQGDMNRFGFEGIMTEAQWCADKGLMVAPHNWGSLVGFYMQLHIGRAVENFYRAEHDPLSSKVLIPEGYYIREGYCSVPDAPGFGLRIDEEAFGREAKIRFDLKA